MKQMIYHTAYPVDTDSVSGAKIRPQKMLQAFKDLGYRVFAITGTGKERKIKIRALQLRLRRGEEFAFLYSENATIPFMISDPTHFPPRFLLDVKLFRLCKRYRIPAGVFYRDLYWKFSDYTRRVGRPLATLMRPLYRYELCVYRHYMKRIFVPSQTMASYCRQLSTAPLTVLPPGGSGEVSPTLHQPLTLLYVGGLGVHYNLQELVRAVKDTETVKLIICAEKSRWENSLERQLAQDAANIEAVHLQGQQLEELYAQVDLGVVMVEPSHYWTLAQPLKFYEYLGHGKPVLATRGIYIAQLVEEAGLGWTLPNQAEQIKAHLARLVADPNLLTQAQNRVLNIRHQHSWQARAKRVAEVLSR